MERSGHWDQLYKSRHPDEVSWYRPHLDLSLSLLRSAALSPGASIIDVGTLLDLEPGRYDFRPDRAVFHFLVDSGARHRYVEKVRRALKPRGHIVVATFGPEGPTRCSGLEVCRYDADTLHSEFGDDFTKMSSDREKHVTPSGSEQEFVYCYCRGPGGGESPPAIAGRGGRTDETDADA